MIAICLSIVNIATLIIVWALVYRYDNITMGNSFKLAVLAMLLMAMAEITIAHLIY